MLERMGYRADLASNGLKALEALRRQSYDVVLMDIYMPEMDGLEATHHICQEWGVDQRPRIIAMTANVMRGDRQICLDAGMDDYISKPIQIEDLANAISRCQPILTQSSHQSADGKSLSSIEITSSIESFDITDITLNTQLNPSSESYESNDLPILDPSALKALEQIASDRTSEFLVKVIDCYFEESSKLLQTAKAAIVQADSKTLRRAFHTLRSSNTTLGAIRLVHLCRELEMFAATGDVESVAEQISKFAAEYEQVKTALQLERQRYQSCF